MLIIITCIFWVLGNFLYMDLNQRYNELKESHEIVMRNISSDKIKNKNCQVYLVKVINSTLDMLLLAEISPIENFSISLYKVNVIELK